MLLLKHLVPVLCHRPFQIGAKWRCGAKAVLSPFDQTGGDGKPHRLGRKPLDCLPRMPVAQEDIVPLLCDVSRTGRNAAQKPQQDTMCGSGRDVLRFTHPASLSPR